MIIKCEYMHKLLSKQIKASRERKWKKKVLLDAKKINERVLVAFNI